MAMLVGCRPATAQPQPTPAPAPVQAVDAPAAEPEAVATLGPSTRPPIDAAPIPLSPLVLEGLDANGLDAHAILCFWQRDASTVKTTCLLLDSNAPTTTVLDSASITDKLVNDALPMNEYGTTMGALSDRLLGRMRRSLSAAGVEI